MYITEGGTTFSLLSFSVYYDGTDAIKFNVEGSDTPYPTANGGTTINTSDYTCGPHGHNCTDKLASGAPGWYTISFPMATYYTEYSIQLDMTGAGPNAVDGLDSIAVGPAPEPASLALLGTGLVGVAAAVRRRTQAA